MEKQTVKICAKETQCTGHIFNILCWQYTFFLYTLAFCLHSYVTRFNTNKWCTPKPILILTAVHAVIEIGCLS